MPAPVTLRVFGAGAGQQLAPAAGGFGVRDVDGLGVEGEAARAHAGDRDEGAGAVAVDLEEEVFAFLGGHWRVVLVAGALSWRRGDREWGVGSSGWEWFPIRYPPSRHSLRQRGRVRSPSRRFGDGAEAGDAVHGLAVGVAAGLGELVAQVDEAVADERERLVVQGGANGADDLMRLLLAAASDHTCRVRMCSLPSSVPVDQSRTVDCPSVR